MKLVSTVIRNATINMNNNGVRHKVTRGDESSLRHDFSEIEKRATELQSRKEFKKALHVYENWLEQNMPGLMKEKELYAECLNNIGHTKYMLVDFSGATQTFDKAINIEPKLATAYYNRGTIRYRMSNFQAAKTDFTRALELRPENEEFKTALRNCLEQLVK